MYTFFRRMGLVIGGIRMFKDWPLWLLHRAGLLRRKDAGTFRMRNGVEFSLDFSRHNPGMFQEIWLMDLYGKYYPIKVGDVVIDLGACIGAFAVLAATKGAKVLAYEPTPHSFEFLQKNSKGYDIAVANAAVAGASGMVTMYEDAGGAEGNSMSKPKRPGSSFTVAATTIDDIFASNRMLFCSLLKIDCEGAEVGILDSLTPATAAQIKNIAMEYHKNRDILCVILERKGFRVLEKGSGEYGYIYAKRAS